MRRLRVLAATVIGVSCLGSGLSNAATPGSVQLPAFEQLTLENGTRIALMEKRDTPLIAVTAVIRGGALGDGPGKEGSAALLAELMQKGAGTRDAAAFAEALESVGAELNVAAGNESLVVGASFLSKDADLVLGLLADALQRPRLEAAEFDKVRTRSIQSIAAAKDSDPRALIGEYGDAWLFGGHPYGRPVGGDEESLAAIGPADVRSYFEQQLGGDRLVLAVVGDFSMAEMRRRVEDAFAGWRKAGAAPPAVPAPAAVKGRRVLLVDKPGATQTYFWLGNVGASRLDPARHAQSLVNTVFGGRFTSMLNTELRIKSGLTYGARSGFDRLSAPGAFEMISYTQTGTTVEAIDLALATLERLHQQGLAADALDSARTYMLGQFPPTLETNGQLAARLADLMFYGLGAEDVNQYAERVSAVDRDAASGAIANAFPKSSDLVLVLIGDAAEIREAVAKYGPVTEMRITDPRFAPRNAKR
jgi:predicted Zn-dependent peptidase